MTSRSTPRTPERMLGVQQGQELVEVSIHLMAIGYREFGVESEKFLAAPHIVVQGAARLRRGDAMAETALALICGGARTHPELRQELVGWLAWHSLERGNQTLLAALCQFPAAEETSLDRFLLGENAEGFMENHHSGKEKLIANFERLLQPPKHGQGVAGSIADGYKVLAIPFQPPLARKILRRTLAGESLENIGNALGLPQAEVGRMQIKVLRSARNWFRRRSAESA